MKTEKAQFCLFIPEKGSIKLNKQTKKYIKVTEENLPSFHPVS